MAKPNLLVVAPPDHYSLRGLEPIRDLANMFVGSDPQFLAQHTPDAEIILYYGAVGHSPAFIDIWKHAKQVKWIHSLSAGVEKMLFPELIESLVPVTNARGVFKRSLADFSILGILYFYKKVRRLVESQRAHKWDNFTVDWIPGKVMGVVGYGEIGKECATLARGLGIKIRAIRRNPERSAGDGAIEKVYRSEQLNEMLSQVDILLAAAPLTPETHHMISTEQFAAMKASAIVINVGRGPVIDEQALIHALQQGQIAGAALDVFESEPLKPDHPFWDMENVLLSPHCTDRTQNPDWLDLSVQCFVDNFYRYIKGGRLENLVDKQAGY